MRFEVLLAVFWEVAPFIAVENDKPLTGIYCHQLSTAYATSNSTRKHSSYSKWMCFCQKKKSYILVTLMRYEEWKSDKTYSINKKYWGLYFCCILKWVIIIRLKLYEYFSVHKQALTISSSSLSRTAAAAAAAGYKRFTVCLILMTVYISSFALLDLRTCCQL